MISRIRSNPDKPRNVRRMSIGVIVVVFLLLSVTIQSVVAQQSLNGMVVELISEVCIEMDEDLWNELRHTAHSTNILIPLCGAAPAESPYEYLPATVTVDGVTLEDVGVRAKGAVGSINPTRPSLKIEFDKFVDGQRLGDRERMTLNNNNMDYSRIKTYLTVKTFLKAGLPAPDCCFARVTVNGTYLGIYTSIEPIKKPFLRKHFHDDEGNLYEGTGSDFLPELINRFERKTNAKTADDRSDLEAVMAALESSDEELLRVLGEVVDLDSFIGFWAMEILVAQWDGYTGNLNNFYIYNDPTTGRFTFIPWSPDTAFSKNPGFNSAGPIFANSILARRLYENQTGRALFRRKIADLYRTVWGRNDLLNQVITLSAALRPYVMPEMLPLFEAETEKLLNVMAAHRQSVYDVLFASAPLPAYPHEIDVPCFAELPNSEPFYISFWTTWGALPFFGAETVDAFYLPEIMAWAPSAFVDYTLGQPGIGTVTITVGGITPPGLGISGMIITVSPYRFLSGEDIAFDNLSTSAMTFRIPSVFNPYDIEIIGVVTDGVLRLNQSGMMPGDVVSGAFVGEITPFPPGFFN